LPWKPGFWKLYRDEYGPAPQCAKKTTSLGMDSEEICNGF
jgi:hypothetical protein